MLLWNSTSRYLDDLLNIDNPYFEQMVGRIYPTELQLNKANSSDTEAPFLDLTLSITNGIVSSKIYDKRDDFNFEIVNFPFLDGDVPCSPSYGVYILCTINIAIVLYGWALPHQISSFILCHEDTSADHLTRFSIKKNNELPNAAAVLKRR